LDDSSLHGVVGSKKAIQRTVKIRVHRARLWSTPPGGDLGDKVYQQDSGVPPQADQRRCWLEKAASLIEKETLKKRIANIE
jgi:hypothetical protein